MSYFIINRVKNLKFKRILRKLLEYLLIYMLFQATVFVADRTVMRHYRLANDIFKSSDFYTAEEAKEFLLRLHPVGSDVKLLFNRLNKSYGKRGWCEPIIKSEKKDLFIMGCHENFLHLRFPFLPIIDLRIVISYDKNLKIRKISTLIENLMVI